MKISNVKKETWIRIIGTVLAVLIVLFLASIKYEFNMDELMSFSLSNSRGTGWVEYNAMNTLYTKGDLNGFMVTQYPFDFLNVIRLQAGDCHPPLFYFGIHFVSSLFPNSLSPMYGISLNIMYYVITSILIFNIIAQHFKHRKMALVCSMVYLFSPAIIEGVLFIRMYTLAAMLSALLIHGCLYVLNKEHVLKGYVYLGIATWLGTLTHYYFYIVLGFTVLYACFVLLKNKDYKHLMQSACVVLLGIGASWIVYPYVFQNIANSAHFKAAIENTLAMSYLSRLLAYYKVNFYGIYFIVLIIAALVYLLSTKKVSLNSVNKNHQLLIPCVTIGYALVISITSTYITNRYMYPIAFMQLMIVTCLYFKVFERCKLPLITNALVILVITIVFSHYRINFDKKLSTVNYAKEKNGYQAVVLTDAQFNYNMSNTLVFDLMNYDNINFSSMQEKPLLNVCDGNKLVIYAWNNMTETEIQEWMRCDVPLQLKDTNLNNASYKIYETVGQSYE